MQKKSNVRNYHVYHFQNKDWLAYGLQQICKTGMICYLFYDSLKAVFLLVPFAIVDYNNMKARKTKEQKKALTVEFKAMMESLTTSLNAGYSLEYAFTVARKDLALLFEKNAYIFEELDRMISGLKMNLPLEQLLKDLGNRSGVDDIQNFANVISAAKRSGGNLMQIIGRTVNSISDKMAVEEEIETMITAKKLEEKIMMVMPYGMILYLRLCNGSFLNVLYHNALGIFIMTVFLILIYIANLWAAKIMEIEV